MATILDVESGDGKNYAAWTLALAYSAAEQESLEKEVELLQSCLTSIIRLERAGGFRTKDAAMREPLESFRRALAALAVFRTKEKQLRGEAKARLEKTQNELRLKGYKLEKNDESDF